VKPVHAYKPDLLVGLGIVTLTILAYVDVGSHGFLNYDDSFCVTVSSNIP